MATTLVITADWKLEDYLDILELSVGDVFKFDNTIDYWTVKNRIEYTIEQLLPVSSPAPEEIAFEIDYIEVGNDLYKEYGPNSFIVTRKEGVNL